MKLRNLLILSIIIINTSCSSVNDFTTGKNQLEQQGYTEVTGTGYEMFCGDKNDGFSTGFSCKDKHGNLVTGCFCSALLKGVTIRFN